MTTALYADEAQLRAWFSKAEPGSAAIVYAVTPPRAPSLDAKNPTVRLVYGWRDRGAAVLTQAKHDGKLHYQVRRAAQPCGETKALRQEREFSESVEGRMLKLLDERARKGQRCPSYSEMARELRLRDRSAAAHRFGNLKRLGLITVSMGPLGRKVRIAATGAETAIGGE